MPSPDPRLFRLHAQFCSVFSHETRLRILWLLGGGERCVSDIAAELGLSVQNVSQHLGETSSAQEQAPAEHEEAGSHK